MSLADERNMVDASGWYIFSTDVIGNRWNYFQNSWGITFAEIESNIYNISSSSPVDISTNIVQETISIPNPDPFTGGHIDVDVDTPVLSIPNGAWNAYDISTNPTIEPFSPYWVHVLNTSYTMTRIVQNDNGNHITKYIDARGIIGYNSYVNTVDIENMISVTVGNLVDTISYSAFAERLSLELVNISKSVKHIQNNAFANCTSLTTVVFQNGVNITNIQANAFNGCTDLTEVYMTEELLNTLTAASGGNQIFVFEVEISFFGASNVTIKKLSGLTKYTV
tara:strand:+ start:1524 stop:2363 length:840 start_codon:yes stop_codon:yes gene_type:complete